MSSSQLKQVATGQVATKRPDTIAGLLTDAKVQRQMALALPKHMTAERLARIALTEVRKVPALGRADQASFLGSIMQCAQLGLEPGSALGHAYLLPFENRKKGITEVQLIVGYRGMIDLARRSGQILSIEARAVYEADQFHVQLGLNSDLQHVPAWDAEDRGRLTFVYAVAKLKDGGVQFEVMSRVEVERVRSKSRSANNGPWVDHFEEMAKKTVIRRLFKYLPVSIEMTRAVGLDEQAEFGVPQNNAAFIDADTGEMHGFDDPNTPANEVEQGAPSAAYADVIAAMLKAKTVDALDEAASLIAAIPDEDKRKELSAKYDALRGELAAA